MTALKDRALDLAPPSALPQPPLLKRLFARSRSAPQPRRNLNLVLRDWHRRAGLFAFLFLAWLGTSGILINQSASWGYDTRRIDWDWVMALYGLHPQPPDSGFRAGQHWLARTADHVLLDARPLEGSGLQPIGFAEATDAGGEARLYLATPQSLIVLDAQGQRLDELMAPVLPLDQLRRIGVVRGVPGSLAVQDLDALQSRDGGETWAPVAPQAVDWSGAEPLPAAERERLLPYSRPSVTLEHVLVDAHSGRLFGSAGAWVINAVGLATLALGISGMWMIWRTRKRRRS